MRADSVHTRRDAVSRDPRVAARKCTRVRIIIRRLGSDFPSSPPPSSRHASPSCRNVIRKSICV